MPADNTNPGSKNAMMRLMRLLGAWRQRRAARRRGGVHSFMNLSDRALADIGLRRADVHGALVGVMPLRRSATAVEPPPDAAIRHLPRRPTLTVVVNDLSAAA
jgi:uncharacterized protein YjiS (DUF1127 family)